MKLQVFFVLLLATCAFASHFRYMTVSWTRPSATSTTVSIKVEQAWRATFFGSPAVGNNINPGSLTLGDGSSRSISLRVTARDLTEDWIVGEFTFSHTYRSIAAYNVLFRSCCRIGTLRESNANTWYRVRTSINLASPILNSPQLTLAPIVDVFINQQNVIRIPRVPPTTQQGLMPDRLQFSVVPSANPSSDASAGSGLNTATPSGLSLSSDGIITWTPTALGLYAFQVEADCPDNIPVFTPLDFIFNVIQGTANLPPSIVDAAGNTIFSDSISVVSGTIATYTIKAVDPVQSGPGIDNFVGIFPSNIPAGVTISPCAEGEDSMGFSLTNECTKTITVDGNVVTNSFPLSLTARDKDGAPSSPFDLTVIYIDPVTPADCRGELHFKACTPFSDPSSTDCASIYVDVEKLFVRGANGGVTFTLQNTCGGVLDNSVQISNAGGPVAQQTAISVVSGAGSAFSMGSCTMAYGLTSPNYNTDLNFALQPDSAVVDPGCFDQNAPVNLLDLVLNQKEDAIELTGLGGDNVDAIRVVSGGCSGVFRSFIDGPCSNDACPL